MNDLVWLVELNDQASQPLAVVTQGMEEFVQSMNKAAEKFQQIFGGYDQQLLSSAGQTAKFASETQGMVETVNNAGSSINPVSGSSLIDPEGIQQLGEMLADAIGEAISLAFSEVDSFNQIVSESVTVNKDFKLASEEAAEAVLKQKRATEQQNEAATGLFGRMKKGFGSLGQMASGQKKAQSATDKGTKSFDMQRTSLGRLHGAVNDNVLGLDQLGLSFSKLEGILRAASVGLILASLLKTALAFERRVRDMNESLSLTPEAMEEVNQSLIRMGEYTGILGVGNDRVAEIAKTGVKFQMMNKTVESGVRDLQNYTIATVELARATELGAEAVGDMFNQMTNLYGIGTQGLRNIGAGIKFITDNTIISAQELVSFTNSLTGLMQLLPENTAKSREEIITELQSIAGVYSKFLDQSKISEMFTRLSEEVELGRDELGRVTGAGAFTNQLASLMGIDAMSLQKMIDKQDYAGVMTQFTSQLNQIASGPQGALRLKGMVEPLDQLSFTWQELLNVGREMSSTDIAKQILAAKLAAQEGESAADAAKNRLDRLTQAWKSFQDVFMAFWAEAGMSINEILVGVVVPLLQKGRELVKWWTNLDTQTQQTHLKIAGLSAAVFVFGDRIFKLIGHVGRLAVGMVKLGYVITKYTLIATYKLSKSLLHMGLVVLRKAVLPAMWFTIKAGVELGWTMMKVLVPAVFKLGISLAKFALANPLLAFLAAATAGVIYLIEKYKDWNAEIKKNNEETIRASGFNEKFVEANANLIDTFRDMRSEMIGMDKSSEKFKRMAQESEALAQGLALQLNDTTKRKIFLENLGLGPKTVQRIMDNLQNAVMEIPVEAPVQVDPNSQLKPGGGGPETLTMDRGGIEAYMRGLAEEGVGALKGLGQDIAVSDVFETGKGMAQGFMDFFKMNPDASLFTPSTAADVDIPGADVKFTEGKVSAAPTDSSIGGIGQTIKSMLSGSDDGKPLKVETDWTDKNIVSLLEGIKSVMENQLGMMKGQRVEQRVQSRRQSKPGTDVDKVAVINQVGPK